MRDRIHRRLYVLTIHADEEMSDDGLTIYDVEHVILTGEILERQRDQVTCEWKYRISGETLRGVIVELVAKISPTDSLVIITVYLLDEQGTE